MSYMGVDIGQTGCKAVIFDDCGVQIASSYREYKTIISQNGWAEIDSKLVIDRCFEAIREARSFSSANHVTSLAISSQGEAFTPLAKDGKILGNAMITFDTRAKSIAKEWSSRFGRKKLYSITGHTAHPMFSLFKLLWIKENKKDIFENTWKFLCFEDLLQFFLGVEPHISWSLAARTMMFDIKRHEWSGTILEEAGITEDKLPVPVPSGRIIGKIKPDVARSLGFSEEVKIVSAGHDQPVGALGAGVIEPGKAMYATGTSECIEPIFSEPILNDTLFENNLCTYDYTIEGLFTTVAFSLTGGNILKWFRDQFGKEEIRKADETGTNVYEILLSKMAKSPTGLLVLPYFTPSGTPYFDPEVSGAIFGLRLSTGREDICRALLEGVAYEMRLNLEILKESGIAVDELRAIGGGAKSKIWTQLKADVLGKPITTVHQTEAAGLGAAILAFTAETGEEIPAIANNWVKTDDVINPDPENASFYSERFGTYKKLYKTVKSLGI